MVEKSELFVKFPINIKIWRWRGGKPIALMRDDVVAVA